MFVDSVRFHSSAVGAAGRDENPGAVLVVTQTQGVEVPMQGAVPLRVSDVDGVSHQSSVVSQSVELLVRVCGNDAGCPMPDARCPISMWLSTGGCARFDR